MINLPLKDKKILFLSVKFFNYETFIREEMKKLGADVDWFDERPANSFYAKAILRLKPELYKREVNKYYERLIKKLRHKEYDYFFLIKGEAVPREFIQFLKKQNPSIKCVFYTWDSLNNSNNCLTILDEFDSKFSFDSYDAEKYGVKFRPLFFIDIYKNLSSLNDDRFDIAFIGTAHSDRYKIAERVKELSYSLGLQMFNFYYSPSKVLFFWKKITDKNFWIFDIKKISFKSLSQQEIINIYKKSNVILDINHPNQTGLTMRTFETLGAGRKLITTNQEIKNYPFYNSNNILIIDRENIQINKEFLLGSFIPIEEDLFLKMSLTGWILEVFGFSNYTWK